MVWCVTHALFRWMVLHLAANYHRTLFQNVANSDIIEFLVLINLWFSFFCRQTPGESCIWDILHPPDQLYTSSLQTPPTTSVWPVMCHLLQQSYPATNKLRMTRCLFVSIIYTVLVYIQRWRGIFSLVIIRTSHIGAPKERNGLVGWLDERKI